MSGDKRFRTEEDLGRVLRALAREFQTETVFIIGSQAILMSWPDAPAEMRGTPEIDAYPGNAKIWELHEGLKGELPIEASEHIHGLFGQFSQFHETHGFYIDGTDEHTAKLPRGWRSRAIERSLEVDGRQVKAIAPAPHDLIVSKLARLDDKDKAFIAAYHRMRPLDLSLIERRLADTELDRQVAERAACFIGSLKGR